MGRQAVQPAVAGCHDRGMDFNGAAGRQMVTGASRGTGRGPVRRLAGRGGVALVAAAAAAVTVTAAGTAASAAGRPAVTWQGPARPAATSGLLTSVAASSASNAWAVGYGGGQALTMHWTGASWTQVPAPAPAYSSLAGVAVGATDAWAVGSTGTDKPLILHWAGSGWARVTVSLPSGSYLYGVTEASARDAWIVGSSGADNWRTLILHWNGTAWKRVASPDPKPSGTHGDTLDAVSAVSPGDAWAAGWLAGKSGNPARGLLLRWNGKAWKRVAAGAIPAQGGVLAGVAGTSRSSAFAVGCDCAKASGAGIADRWTGRSWAKMRLPARPAVATIATVAAATWRNAWAIGMYCTKKRCTDGQGEQPMLLHWNGKSWQRTAASLPARAFLGGVAVVSASDAWAVGGSQAGGSLILHWNGTAWAPSS